MAIPPHPDRASRLPPVARQALAVWLVFAIAAAVGTFWFPTFGAAFHVATFVNVNAPLVILAAGVAVVVARRRIDLSIGASTAVAVVAAAASSPWGPIAAAVGAIAVGVGFGALNAGIVAVARLPTWAATAATWVVATAVAHWLPTPAATGLADRWHGTVPTALALAIAIVAAAWCLNRHLAARERHTVTIALIFSGLCAGIAGFAAAAVAGGIPSGGTAWWGLTAIVAAVLGGRGAILGAVGAAFLIAIVFDLVSFGAGGGAYTVTAVWQPVGLLAFLAVAVVIARLARGTGQGRAP